MTDPLPFLVIGGYLGAGKTTLINRLLASGSAGRAAVLVNDFGDVDIDSSLIESDDGNTISLANGCICCSLADGFLSALERVRIMAADLDRVIVEVSGVGEPWKVAQWGRTPGFDLDAVICLADASTLIELADDGRVGDTVRRQLAGADIVVMTKNDLVDPDRVAKARQWIRTETDARVVDGREANGLVDMIIGGSQLDRLSPTAPGPQSGHARHVIASGVFDSPLEPEVLDGILAGRPKAVMRVKGHVMVAGEPEKLVRVQVVGRRVETTVVNAPPHGIRPVMVAVATDEVSSKDLHDWLEAGAASGTHA